MNRQAHRLARLWPNWSMSGAIWHAPDYAGHAERGAFVSAAQRAVYGRYREGVRLEVDDDGDVVVVAEPRGGSTAGTGSTAFGSVYTLLDRVGIDLRSARWEDLASSTGQEQDDSALRRILVVADLLMSLRFIPPADTLGVRFSIAIPIRDSHAAEVVRERFVRSDSIAFEGPPDSSQVSMTLSGGPVQRTATILSARRNSLVVVHLDHRLAREHSHGRSVSGDDREGYGRFVGAMFTSSMPLVEHILDHLSRSVHVDLDTDWQTFADWKEE